MRQNVPDDPGDGDETYEVSHLGTGTNQGTEKIGVTAFGYTQTIDNVTSIYADGGLGNNVIIVDKGVTSAAELHGGQGNDTVTYLGSGTAKLYGGPGTNVLTLGPDAHDSEVHGGTGSAGTGGDATITLGGNGDKAYGEGGTNNTDILNAGPGNNQTLYGGQGKNQFFAGLGTSTMDGGAGSNLYVWQAGMAPNGSVVVDGAITVNGMGSNNILETDDHSKKTDVLSIGATGGAHVQAQFNNAQVIDATDLQEISMDTNGSPDTVTFSSLASTSVNTVAVNLGSEAGTADNLLQTFTLNGAAGAKTVSIIDKQFPGTVTQPVNGQPQTMNVTAVLTKVTGLGPTFFIANPEDKLIVEPGDGNTTVNIATTIEKGAVEVDGGTGTDVYNVQSVSGPTTIKATGGNNTFNVGSTAPAFFGNIVDGIQGALTITGSGGTDTMNVSDIASSTSKTGFLTSTTLTGMGMGPKGISYSGLSNVNVILGGGSANQFNIQSTLAGTSYFVAGFFGTDTFYVGSKANNAAPDHASVLATIQGPLTLSGDPGDTANFDDSVNSLAETGLLTSTTFTGMGMGSSGITYTGLAFLNIWMGTGGDTMNVQSTAAGTTTTIDPPTGSPNTFNIGSLAPTLMGGVVDLIQGPLVIVGSGADTMNVDDTGSTMAKTGTLTESKLTGLNMAGITYSGLVTLNINLGSGGNAFTISVPTGANLPVLTNINGGSSNSDSLNASWVTDFNGTLNLLGFEHATIMVGNNFNGTMTDLSPGHIEQLTIGNSLTALGVLLAGSIDNMSVGVDLAGIVTVLQALANLFVGHDLSGTVTETGTVQTLTIGHSLTSTGTFYANGDINQTSVGHDVAGLLQATGNMGTVMIGGSVTVTGRVIAGGNITTMLVGQDVAGLVQAGATIHSLSVGHPVTYTGIVQAGGNLDTMTVGPDQFTPGDDMAGRIIVGGTLGDLRVAGGTLGTIVAGQVGTVRVYGGYGPLVLQINEAGIQRRVEAAVPGMDYPIPLPPPVPTPPTSPAGVTFQYIYEGFASQLHPAQPCLTARVTNNAPARDQYDLSLVVWNDAAKFNLARLDANGVSGIRNVAVEGDLRTSVSAAAAKFIPSAPANEPAGIYLPSDALAGVGVRDYAPNGLIQAKSIQAVAFGSHTDNNAIGTGAVADAEDAAQLLASGTAIVQANDTFRVPFADLPSQQVGFFFDSAEEGGHFDGNNVVFVVQGVSSPNSNNTGNIVMPSNAARGAATALVKVAQTFDNDGHADDSVVQRIDVRGDGASIQTQQYISQAITSTGPLGDLLLQPPQGIITTLLGNLLQSHPGITDVTAPSIFGSIITSGPITGTMQTTGVRTDPITGLTSTVPADLGRLFVDTTDRDSPVLATTTVQANGLSGRLIVRGNLISQVEVNGAMSGLVAVQGNINETSAKDEDGHPIRLGGLVVNGDITGQLVTLGTIYADVIDHGALRGGRIAVKGDILGNLFIDGEMNAASAVVVAGRIGDATAGTVMKVWDVEGILAAEGSIRLDQTPYTQHAAFFGQNLKTTDPMSTAAIDAIFTDMGNPLAFDKTGLDLAGLGSILTDLAKLHVGTNGKFTGTTP